MKRFCPKCGKEIDEESQINSFCIDCYVSEHQVITAPTFEITVCPKCGVLKYAKKFYKTVEDLEKDLAKHIKTKDLDQAKVFVKLILDDDLHEYYIIATVKALIGNKIKEIKMEKDISLRKNECERCSRLSGNYYTTILQLRFDDSKIKEELMDKIILQTRNMLFEMNESRKNLSRQVHIVKEKPQKTGIDIYLDNLDQSKKILQTLILNKNAKSWQETKSLVTADKKGKRVYRHTLCIHFESGQQKVTHII